MTIPKVIHKARRSSDLNLITGGKQDEWITEQAKIYWSIKTEDIVFKFYNLRTKQVVEAIDHREPFFIKAYVRVWNSLPEDDKKNDHYDKYFNRYQPNETLSWMFHNKVFASTSRFHKYTKIDELETTYKGKFSREEIAEMVDSITTQSGEDALLCREKKQALEVVIARGFNPNLLIYQDWSKPVNVKDGLAQRSDENRIIHCSEVAAMTLEYFKPRNEETFAALAKTCGINIKQIYHLVSHPHLACFFKTTDLKSVNNLFLINDSIDPRVLDLSFYDITDDELELFLLRRTNGSRRFLLSFSALSDPLFVSKLISTSIANSHNILRYIPKHNIKKIKESLAEDSNSEALNQILELLTKTLQSTGKDIDFIVSILPKHCFNEELLHQFLAAGQTSLVRLYFSNFPLSLRKKHQETLFNKTTAFFGKCTKSFQQIEKNYMRAAEDRMPINMKIIHPTFDPEIYLKILSAQTAGSNSDMPFMLRLRDIHEEFLEFLRLSASHGLAFEVLDYGREDGKVIFMTKEEVFQLRSIHLKRKMDSSLDSNQVKKKKLKI